MTIEQMRSEISLAYPGEAWTARVNRMGDNQVIAVYHRLSTTGKLEEAMNERKKKKSSPEYVQLSMFDKGFAVQ